MCVFRQFVVSKVKRVFNGISNSAKTAFYIFIGVILYTDNAEWYQSNFINTE